MEIGEPVAKTRSRALQLCRASPDALLAMIPRRRRQVFAGPVFLDPNAEAAIPPEAILDRLPSWRRAALGEAFVLDRLQRIKNIEHRFHLDAATKVGDEWLARRRISVVCLHARPGGKYLPAAGIPLTVTLEAGGGALRFEQASGDRVAQLAGADQPRTDASGMAEFVIVHPAAPVAPDRRQVRIVARAAVPLLGPDGKSTSTRTEDLEAELTLSLVRNEAAARLEEVFDRPADERSADRIWLFQPANPDPRSEGLRELQEVLNDVVPRHRAVPLAPDGFLTRTGIFDDETRKMLQRYLEHFPNVHAGSEYPYELKDIGPDPDLLTYLKEEYEPFDPTKPEERGKVVDRRLLVGKVKDTAPAKIDGLWELHDGVVKVLRDQVRAYAQSYLDCDTFWLHRPIHQKYVAATDQVFACTGAGVPLRIAPQESAPPVVHAGTPVTLSVGDHLLVIGAAQGGWVELRHATGAQGWVHPGPTAGRLYANDAGRYRTAGAGAQEANWGNQGTAGSGHGQQHTANGVAYSYGGKQTPPEWRASLEANGPEAAPDRIVSYEEYAAARRFGSTKSEIDQGNFGFAHAGCDCSGFVQNCVTHAVFPRTDRRIVAAALCTAQPTSIAAADWAQTTAGQGPTRLFQLFASVEDRRWLRGADVLCTNKHVVLVSEDHPPITSDSSNDFMILHECGMTEKAPDAFTRKSVRSPFSWWGIPLKTARCGKLMIWR